ncbi:hypothetical protein [Actinacidiphila sp. bgisy144]|uniref:hypothetical protein n=1 Tax=Actinacidiphila sp. bgisy144 TaxID=3413791 RepID=UPI003EBC1703
MHDSATRPPFSPTDIVTPVRSITHGHFRPGDSVIVFRGVAGDSLWGDIMTIVASSWHDPTDEAGWRLRNPRGGDRSYITAHPRYLAHLGRSCADCLIYHRALQDYLLPKVSAPCGPVDVGWYTLTRLNHLVHVDERRR